MSKSVLVIDDSSTVRLLIARGLRLAGYEVVEAGNVAEGFARLLCQHIDLVLCDYHLPDNLGTKFVRELREISECPDVPVILMSVDGEIAKVAESCHATGYIMKPFGTDQLLQAMDELWHAVGV